MGNFRGEVFYKVSVIRYSCYYIWVNYGNLMYLRRKNRAPKRYDNVNRDLKN